jgi:predicted Rossmann fold flavoprotein
MFLNMIYDLRETGLVAAAAALQTIVVGGGAAGMMAAISAARSGRKVALLEGNSQLGRKILISGNGRCNLTNLDADSPHHYHGERPEFVRRTLASFPLARSLEFFHALGIETKQEKRGRLFPRSDQARSVVDLLIDELAVSGVRVATDAKAVRLSRRGNGFSLVTREGDEWLAERVILASGGVSLPKLGADASGLALAQGLGHTATPLLPGLVPLESSDRFARRMQGVKVWAEVSAPVSKSHLVTDTDDLLLTKYGVSGFTILNLSAQLVPALERGPVELRVNLFSGQSPEQVSERLRERWARQPHRTLELSFAGLLASKITGPLLDKLKLSREQIVDTISKAQRWLLAQTLTAWPIVVTGPRSFDYAEVTIGGIRTDEVDPVTLESRLVPGLFLAGEMLDVHGDLGGYNFQWAWSSGAVAGQGLLS